MTEAFIEGSVDVTNIKLNKLLKEHNQLINEQNTILERIVELLEERQCKEC